MNWLRLRLIVAVVWGLPAAPLLAVGISIQPARLELAAEWGSEVSGQMLVANVTRQPAMYQVLNPPATDEVWAQPSSFRLDPGGSQLVTVTYAPRSIVDRQATLSVVARPLDGASVTLASGIRYPLTLVATSRWVNTAVRGSLVTAVLAVALLYRRRATFVEI